MRKRIMIGKVVFFMFAMVLFSSVIFSSVLQSEDKTLIDLINQYDEYDMEHIIGTSLTEPPLVNEDSKIAWGLSRTILSLLRVYVSTNDINYLHKAASAIDSMILLRDDKRKASVFDDEQTQDAGDPVSIVSILQYNYDGNTNDVLSIEPLELPAWRNMSMIKGIIRDNQGNESYPTYPERDELNRIIYNADGTMKMNPILEENGFTYSQLCYPIESHTGLILFPIIRFVYILDSLNLWEANEFHYNNFLKSNISILNRETLINTVEESFNLINNNQFITSPHTFYNHQTNSLKTITTDSLSDSAGTYKIREDVYYNTAIQPASHLLGFSHNAQLGRVGLYLDLVNDYTTYSSRAGSLYQYFEDWVEIDDDDAYVWRSRPTGAISDVSHAFYSVDYAKLLYQLDIINENKIQYYVNTFLRNIFVEYSDGEYIFAETVDGYSSTQYYNVNTKLPCWAILTQFDPRVYELCYYCVKECPSYIGLSFVIDEYRNYQPCIVSSSPENVLCNHTENLEIRFNNIKILGDLEVEVSQNDTVYFKCTMHQTKATDTIWNVSLPLANFNTKYTDPIKVKYYSNYYSDNDSILGPMRIFEIPVLLEFVVEHPEVTGFGYTKTDIIVKDKITGLPLDSTFVCCYIAIPSDTGDIIIENTMGYTDANGYFEYTHHPKSVECKIEITTTRQNYLPYEGECLIRDRTVYAYYDNNVPVFDNDSLIIEVLSSKKPDLPEIINPAIEDAKVVLTNRDNIYIESYTDENGIAKFPSYISNLRNIQVYIFSDYNRYEPTANYNAYEGDVIPYMWSNIPDAAGKNNQRNLVKLPNSNICYMAYSDGDSIIVGKGTVSGMITDLQKVGRGINPVLSEIDNGIFVMWGASPGLYYATVHSPISPVDTFIHFPPTINFSETVLEGNPDNDHIMGSVLEYRYIGSDNADLIYAEFDEELNVITMDTLIPYTGDEIHPEIVPMRSPIVSYYVRWSELYPVTGFIDTMGVYRSKMVDYKDDEWEIWDISEATSTVNDISVNVYGNTTTFLWEKEIVPDVVTEIWAKKMIEGVMQPSYKVSPDFGDELYYPICAHGNIYSCIDKRTAGDVIRVWTEDSLIWSYTSASHKYYPSIEIVNTLLGVFGQCIWTEQAGDDYEKPYIIRDKTFTVSEEDDPYRIPLFKAIPYDTQIVYESAIYEYVNGNPPVNRLSYTAPGLDPEKYYIVEVITSENSPKKPQIISIDGDVFDVVYGKKNEENISIIELPLEYYEDRRITVSIDRLNGNPQRTADISIYEYEVIDETGTSAGGNKLVFNRDSDIFNIDYKEQIYSYNLYFNFNRHNNEIYFTLPENNDITISLYDITGRNIKCLYNGYVNRGKHTVQLPNNLSAGVYFIRLYGQGVNLQHKIVNIAK